MKNIEENFGVIYDKKEYAGFLKRVAIALVDIIVITIVSVCCIVAAGFLFDYEDSYYTLNFLYTFCCCAKH